ncbi:MAG: glycoside hydrolase family 127 protein, partial [Lachnospiraceae bacterium]|nr:glycoside hydrolase family 127 protein [Lachnospiraceae bacterium]
IGSTHLGEAFSYPFDLPNDTAYAESCAAIGLVFFARRMLQLSPRSEYADIMEKCLYNGILSGMALDGRSFFYVNPLEVFPEADNNDGRKKHVKTVRQKWFGCACCPPNIARMIASVGAYAYTETDDTLFVNLYLGSEYEKEIGKKTAKVVMENVGDDPACWKYRCRIEGAADEKLTIAFRKPEWCAGFALSTSGADITEKDGYFYVTKTLTGEDEILVTLPLRVRFMTADTRVREDTGKAAVQFGPWVYCAEEIDNGKNLHLLRLPCDVTADKVRLGTIEIAGRSAVSLTVPAYRLREETSKGLYFELAPQEMDAVSLTMIPYYMWANRGENEMLVFLHLV